MNVRLTEADPARYRLVAKSPKLRGIMCEARCGVTFYQRLPMRVAEVASPRIARRRGVWDNQFSARFSGTYDGDRRGDAARLDPNAWRKSAEHHV
jgi:hypothetical protein